jgi:hypothetical protein
MHEEIKLPEIIYARTLQVILVGRIQWPSLSPLVRYTLIAKMNRSFEGNLYGLNDVTDGKMKMPVRHSGLGMFKKPRDITRVLAEGEAVYITMTNSKGYHVAMHLPHDTRNDLFEVVGQVFYDGYGAAAQAISFPVERTFT